jgi:hypothetical protein
MRHLTLPFPPLSPPRTTTKAVVSGDVAQSVRVGRLLGVLVVSALDATVLAERSTSVGSGGSLVVPTREVSAGTAYVHFTSGSTGVRDHHLFCVLRAV